MEITIKIPDELARQVASEGKEPARVALEALALEGYRAEQLSESAVRQMLGFESIFAIPSACCVTNQKRILSFRHACCVLIIQHPFPGYAHKNPCEPQR
jgi:hypothetical protein